MTSNQNTRKKIPVTVLTGFLGAGKTTLLNRIIRQNENENIIVIVNEFGETGIDHQLVLLNEEERIYQMNNGCMCCVLRDDLVEMFFSILSARDNSELKIDRIIIETSGLAEPSPIAQTILRTPVLSDHLVVDSILTLVDVENALYQMRNYNESVEQVAFADRVLLTKTTPENSVKTQLVIQTLKDINPFVEIKELDINTVSFDEIIGLDLFDRATSSAAHVDEDINAMLERKHHHDHDHEHDHHHSEVDSFSIVLDAALEESKLATWLNLLILQYGMDLLRYKGILNLKDVDNQVVLQGINMAFRTDIGKKWEGLRQTKIVIIGRNLPESQIRQLLFEIVSTSNT